MNHAHYAIILTLCLTHPPNFIDVLVPRCLSMEEWKLCTLLSFFLYILNLIHIYTREKLLHPGAYARSIYTCTQRKFYLDLNSSQASHMQSSGCEPVMLLFIQGFSSVSGDLPCMHKCDVCTTYVSFTDLNSSFTGETYAIERL